MRSSFHAYNKDFANYVDDATVHVAEYGMKEAIDCLKTASDDLFCWLTSNQMKANPVKCHLIVSCDSEMSICANNCNRKKKLI